MAAQGPRPKYWELYPKDFWADADVDALDDPVHRCAYLALLSWAWERGARLRSPYAALRSLGFSDADASSIWQALLPLWFERPDGWTQHRLARDYAKATERRGKAIERAQRGAEGRWKDKGNASSIASSIASSNQQAMPSDSDSDSDSDSYSSSDSDSAKPERDGATPPPAEPAPPPSKASKARKKPLNLTLAQAIATIDAHPELEPVRDLWAAYLAAIDAWPGRKLPAAGQAKHRLDGARRVLASHGLAGLRESIERATAGNAERGPWDSFPPPRDGNGHAGNGSAMPKPHIERVFEEIERRAQAEEQSAASRHTESWPSDTQTPW